jgi:oxalate decarboxylase/phosphoglucose isomerase-like protein (cupin superfamily)
LRTWEGRLERGELASGGCHGWIDDRVPPGCAVGHRRRARWLERGAVIGEHVHTHTEELYYIVSGVAEMRLGDEARRVGPGDLIVTPLNGRHGISNVGDTDLDFLVIEVHPPAITSRLPRKVPVAAGGDDG